MKPEDSITQVIATFTPLIARGANIVQDVAGRVLGDAVAQRLHLDSHEEENFRRNPHSDYPGAGQVQARNSSGTVSAVGVAVQGGSYHQGDNITTNIIKSGAGRIGVLTAIAIAVCGGLIVRGGGAPLSTRDAGLNAGSTCQRFLHASEYAEQQALAGLAVPAVPGGPPVLRRIRCECHVTPAMTIGGVLAKVKGAD